MEEKGDERKLSHMVQVVIAAMGMGMEKGEESRVFCKSLADRSLW